MIEWDYSEYERKRYSMKFYDPETGRVSMESLLKGAWLRSNEGPIQDTWPRVFANICPNLKLPEGVQINEKQTSLDQTPDMSFSMWQIQDWIYHIAVGVTVPGGVGAIGHVRFARRFAGKVLLKSLRIWLRLHNHRLRTEAVRQAVRR